MKIKKKTLSLATHVMYGSSRLGTMDYLPMQYGMSYERIGLNERTRDTLGLSGHRPYYAFAGHQLATGGQGIYGQHSWASLPHKGQHLIGQKQYELSNHLGNVQVTVSDLPFKQKVNDTLVYSTALKSVYDYYPFGSLMPGRTVMDTARKCVDMTRLERVWQPAVIDMDPLTPYFMNISGWGAANYEFRDGNTQLLIEIEDSKSGLEIALDPSITEGEIVLKTKVFEISDNGILLRVQGVDSNGDARMFYQSHEQIIEESLVIPLKAGYTHYSILIQGAVSMVFDGGTIYNGHWVETEVLVRVCDDGGDQYRFGFNGQEKVNEVSGMGNHNTAEFWEYDTRLGRRWNVDPVDQISVSNYAVFRNNPIFFKDPNGDDPAQRAYRYASRELKLMSDEYSILDIPGSYGVVLNVVSFNKEGGISFSAKFFDENILERLDRNADSYAPEILYNYVAYNPLVKGVMNLMSGVTGRNMEVKSWDGLRSTGNDVSGEKLSGKDRTVKGLLGSSQIIGIGFGGGAGYMIDLGSKALYDNLDFFNEEKIKEIEKIKDLGFFIFKLKEKPVEAGLEYFNSKASRKLEKIDKETIETSSETN